METKKLTAKDLMVGDWVLCVDSTHENKTYAQIDAIEEGQRCILVREGNRNWFLDIADLQPIPLTEEILEKNGYHYNVGPGGLFQINIKGLNCHISFNIIHYVHELQHALRLCGKDKEIKL